MDGRNRPAQGDFVDNLPPGYRFCPTDSELIVHYLNPKIKTGITDPNCRLYEVNLYNYVPDELSSQPQYRDCDGNWYFLTPLERKYPKGNRPNRRITKGEGQSSGYWKASQKFTTVYDDADQQQVVGTKRSLAFHDENNRKTEWLMYEYTTDGPNLPIGTNMLTTWVLCKIYKKEKRTDDNNQAEQVPNTSNQTDEYEEQNQPLDAAEPSPRRRKVSNVAQSSSVSSTGHTMLNATNSFRSSDGASNSTPTEPLAIDAVPPQPPTDNMMGPMCPYPVTSTNFLNWDFASVNSTGQEMLNATNSFRSSNGASSCTPTEPLPIAAVPPQPPTNNMMATCSYPLTSTNFSNWDFASLNSTGQTVLNTANSFRSSNGALNSSLAESLPIVAAPPQPPTDNNMMATMFPYPVTSTYIPNWDFADNIPLQLNDIDTTGSLFDEGLMSYSPSLCFTYEELFNPY